FCTTMLYDELFCMHFDYIVKSSERISKAALCFKYLCTTILCDNIIGILFQHVSENRQSSLKLALGLKHLALALLGYSSCSEGFCLLVGSQGIVQATRS